MGRVKAMEAAGVPKADIDKYIKAAASELSAQGGLVGSQPVPTVTPKMTTSQVLEPPYVPPRPGLLTQAFNVGKKVADFSQRTLMAPAGYLGEAASDVIKSAQTGVTQGKTQQVADFGRKIGLGGVGDLAGRDVFHFGTQQGEDLMQQERRGEISKAGAEAIRGGKVDVPGLFTKEFIGSAIQTAAIVATAGAPLNTSAKMALKQGAIKQGVSAIGSEIENDQTLKHALVAVPVRAALGSIFEVISYGAFKALDHLLTKSPTELTKHTLHQTQDDLLREAQGKTPDLGKQVEKMKWVMGTAKLNEGAIGGVKMAGDAIDDQVAELAKQGVTVDAIDFVKRASDKTTQLANAEGMDSAAAGRARDFVQSKVDDWLNAGYDIHAIPIDVAHKFIKDTYAVLGEKAGPALGADLSMSAVQRVAVGGMRQALGEAAPGLDAAIFEQQFWIRLVSATMKDFVKDPAKIQQMTDVLLAGNVLMTHPGAGATIGLFMKAWKSHLGARAAAVWLDGVNDVVQSLPTEAMRHAADAAFMALYNYTGNVISPPKAVDTKNRDKAKEFLMKNKPPAGFKMIESASPQ